MSATRARSSAPRPTSTSRSSTGGTAPGDISGWTLFADDPGQNFTFPPNTVLQPGQRIRIHANEVHPEWGGHVYGIGRPLWNDKGDTARLRDTDDTVVSDYSYGAGPPDLGSSPALGPRTRKGAEYGTVSVLRALVGGATEVSPGDRDRGGGDRPGGGRLLQVRRRSPGPSPPHWHRSTAAASSSCPCRAAPLIRVRGTGRVQEEGQSSRRARTAFSTRLP
ncbi:lamin tail domain-containing protein [Streptomyces sp. NPDC094466]|uniref:lamin tail domain-containing protein n=1 Tax=Streptomyces sp. NPDC094466 TaxID=3366065 RepID=UPI0038246500